MKIFDIIEGTRVNGPGLRLGIWFAGCNRACPGCFNLEAQDEKNSYEKTVKEILALLEKREMDYQGISISGGEPFLQEKELYELLREVKKIKKREKSKYDCLVFTGFTYEELVKREEYRKVLAYVDILVDGPFILEKKEENRCFLTGSANQRVLFLEDGNIKRDATEDFLIDKDKDFGSSEIFVSKDGKIKITGFDDISL